MLVDLLLRELLVCSGFLAPKPYLGALCRVAAALEAFPVGEAEGGVSARARPASWARCGWGACAPGGGGACCPPAARDARAAAHHAP